MQRVFEMYRDRGFTVLAINVEPEQRNLVAPVMTALVDQQGRIMFKPHVHDAETRGVLAREVEALLNRQR